MTIQSSTSASPPSRRRPNTLEPARTTRIPLRMTTPKSFAKHAIIALTLTALSLASACKSHGDLTSPALGKPARPDISESSPQQTSQRSRPVALIANQPLFAETISPQVAELSGGIAIEEYALDAMLTKTLSDRGLTIDQRAIDAERSKLTEAIADEAQVTIDQASEMLASLRVGRGLGPTRFDQLLSRNAKLRALAQQQVTITPEMLAKEEAFANGPRVRIRLAVLPTQVAASTLRTNVLATTGEQRIVRFATLALEHSLDSTAAAGGLIASVSPQDPSLPAILRNSLASLRSGDVSDVLSLPSGFGVVLREGDVAPGAPIDRAKIEAKLRSRLERLAMDAITRQLIKDAQVQVLDPSFAWSWEARAAGT